VTNEEITAWWIDKHKAKVYRNTKLGDKRECGLDCGHEWKVIIPNPDPNHSKDSLVGCADTVEGACQALHKILFCSKNFDVIFCSDGMDYRKELEHKCDGFYCGAREQYEYMDKYFKENKIMKVERVMFCSWMRPWSYDKCGAEATITGMCEEHTQKCVGCDNMAINGCSFAGQFVCGYPICGKCNHMKNHYKNI